MNLFWSGIVALAITLNVGADLHINGTTRYPGRNVKRTVALGRDSEVKPKNVSDSTWRVGEKKNNTKVTGKRGTGWRMSDYLRVKESPYHIRSVTDAPDSAWGVGTYLGMKKNNSATAESWGEDLVGKVTDQPDSAWGMGDYLRVKNQKNQTKLDEFQ